MRASVLWRGLIVVILLIVLAPGALAEGPGEPALDDGFESQLVLGFRGATFMPWDAIEETGNGYGITVGANLEDWRLLVGFGGVLPRSSLHGHFSVVWLETQWHPLQDALRQHGFFGGLEVIHHDRDVVERTDSFVAGVHESARLAGIVERDVMRLSADMFGMAPGHGVALPSQVPAKDFAHPIGGGGGVRDGEIGMFKLRGHGVYPFVIACAI